MPELAGGFDAMGFSQGGQFLRYVLLRWLLMKRVCGTM